MYVRAWLLISALCLVALIGCRTKYREDLDYSYAVEQTWPLEDLQFGEIVQFESVFWEPDDTVSLRRMLIDDTAAAGRDVLEIGTGTGLIAIVCLQNDASNVVATDINPAAVANAKYNAAILAPDEKLEVRQVPKENPGAFQVIGKDEKFDLIISNPPWEDGVVSEDKDHAFYDPHFALMQSLLDGLPDHLNAGGRCLLAYGHVPAIKRLQEETKQRGYDFKILDDRELDSLDRDFLPGMLVEIRLPLDRTVVSGGQFKNMDDLGDSSTAEDESTPAEIE
jgi:release factor glutamine methyltransferase